METTTTNEETTMMTTLTRTELEAAYIAAVPEIHREGTRARIAAYSTEYLIARLAPAPRARPRGPRIARHANDRGAS